MFEPSVELALVAFYDDLVRLLVALLVVVAATFGGAGSLRGAGASPAICVIQIAQLEYQGVKYRQVPLVLSRQEPLGTVTVWQLVPECRDTVIPNAPQPPPAPPSLRRFDIPIERLAGIPPNVAVGATHHSYIWVPESCPAAAPMDVAVSCLGLTDAAAYRAAKEAAVSPLMFSSIGAFPLIFRSARCVAVAPSASNPPAGSQALPALPCSSPEGAIKRYPRAPVRLGETIRFDLGAVDSVTISYGRHRPVEVGPLQNSDVAWRVPASGRYTLSIVVRSSNPQYRLETTYTLALRVDG